jgi:SynChlorMet cassette protein ScmD
MTKKLIKNPDAILREESDDWAVVSDVNTGLSFGLAPIGVFIWKRLDGQHTEQEILNEIKTHFKNAPTDADQHLSLFIRQLEQKGLVQFI